MANHGNKLIANECMTQDWSKTSQTCGAYMILSNSQLSTISNFALRLIDGNRCIVIAYKDAYDFSYRPM